MIPLGQFFMVLEDIKSYGKHPFVSSGELVPHPMISSGDLIQKAKVRHDK